MHVESFLKGMKPKTENDNIWLSSNIKDFRKILKELKDLSVTRISSISGTDAGKYIEVIYHLIHKNRTINIRVPVDKKNHTIQTITDLYPGANLFERELSEMLGIHIKGHPNPKRLFLAHDSPETPLRRS
jgi:NADH:ubiquinone oxidoreductase subunit C